MRNEKGGDGMVEHKNTRKLRNFKKGVMIIQHTNAGTYTRIFTIYRLYIFMVEMTFQSVRYIQ